MARPLAALLQRPIFALGLLLGCPSAALPQAPEGARVFQASCATCHTGASDSRAPGLDALRARTPQAVIDSLLTGAMRPQGARLSGAERRAVAEFITGRSIEGDVSGAEVGRCTASGALQDFTKAPRWSGWSPSTTNTRFQPAEQAGLAPSDLPRLTLKWAFGFPDASVAWSHPTVAAGRLFVGSQNGTVYALDSKTGCIHWTFSASGGVRTAVAVAPAGGSGCDESTIIPRLASPVRRRSLRAGCMCRSPHTKRHRAPIPGIRAVRFAGALRPSMPSRARSSGRPT